MGSVHSLEVVGRGSEKQLHVSENLFKLLIINLAHQRLMLDQANINTFRSPNGINDMGPKIWAIIILFSTKHVFESSILLVALATDSLLIT